MSKKVFTRAAIAAFAALAFSPAAFAQNMAVSASVTGTCLLGTVNALDFGALDPVLAPAVTGVTTTITYRCTKGRSPTSLTIGGGGSPYTGSMSGPLSSSIPFSLTWGALPAGTGMSAAVALTVTGAIASGTYSDAAAGAYSASVPVVFTP